MIDVFDTDTRWSDPDLETALRGLRSSGVAALAIDHSGAAAVDAAHAAVLAGLRRADGG
ncbi:MAG: Demethylmenaquinone methyltransferase, partial [Ramlibacter sp.]|nr:Demethylmenaquinone methyltransferase [Ramlibacter sp.]